MKKLATANKAFVAALCAAAAAAAPKLIEAVNGWVSAVVGLIVAGLATYATKNAAPDA